MKVYCVAKDDSLKFGVVHRRSFNFSGPNCCSLSKTKKKVYMSAHAGGDLGQSVYLSFFIQ